MRDQVAALVERALPRAFSAVVMLMFAALTDPSTVGIYGIVTLMYTAAQATTDTAVRQVLLRAVSEPAGEAFLRNYQRFAPILSSAAILGLLIAMKLTGVVPTWTMALELSPIAVAPWFAAWGIPAVGTLQALGRWRTLAQGQLLASFISLAVSVPLMLTTRSVVGPSLQLLLMEAVLAVWCVRAARGLQAPIAASPATTRTLRADMTSMSAFSFVAWAQGQAERALMVIFVGTSALGSYTTASAIARAPGDALAASTANVVRTAVAPARSPREVRDAAEKALMRAMVLAAAAVAVSVVAAYFLRAPLGPQWSEALAIVPILAISAFPSMLSWTSAVLQVRVGRAWQTLWAPLVGLLFAVGIAAAAAHSLPLASYLVVARDLAVVTVGFLLIRNAAPWRAYFMCWGAVLVLCAGTLFLL